MPFLILNIEMVTKPRRIWGKGGWENEICDVCEREVDATAVTIHRIVPEGITKEAGISDSETVRLCINCRDDIHAWYLNRVLSETYDWGIKRFRPKSPTEMVKEYEAAYRAFVRYTRWRHNIV